MVRLSLSSVVAVLLMIAQLRAQEAASRTRWPQFRGPNAAGVAAEGMKLPVHFGPDKNVLWKIALPPGHSSPCIWDDRIFLTGFNKEAKKVETLCVDRHKGQILWRQSVPVQQIEKLHKFNTPAVATPATDGERVYVYFGSFGLLCYDLEGKELWRKPLPLANTTFGTGSSPVVAGDLVLLNRDYLPEPSLLAVRARTGETAWKQVRKLASTGGPVDAYATPVIWRHDGVEEVLLHGKVRQVAYDLKDGSERWSVNATSSACSTPVLGDGCLFLAAHGFGSVKGEMEELPDFDELLKKADKNGDGFIGQDEFPNDLNYFQRLDVAGTNLPLKRFFSMMDANRDGKIDRDEWEKFRKFMRERAGQMFIGMLAIKPGTTGDVSKTNIVWREEHALPEVPSPIYYRERVYMVRDGGLASCLDAHTGKLSYRERLGASGPYFSSPVAGDGKLYVGSQHGVLVVFAAGDNLKVLARNDLGEAIHATPALVDGKIYLRTEKHLYAFGEEK